MTEPASARADASWTATIEAITLFVEDLPATRRFYELAFESEPYFEDESSTVFRVGSVLVNLLKVEAAPELVEPAPVGRADAGVRFQLTVGVDDVDATCERLRSRGIALLNGPMDRPWGVRTAAFRDPAGHVWELASPIS